MFAGTIVLLSGGWIGASLVTMVVVLGLSHFAAKREHAPTNDTDPFHVVPVPAGLIARGVTLVSPHSRPAVIDTAERTGTISRSSARLLNNGYAGKQAPQFSHDRS
jgi:hypothetical protein